jgi:integrase
MAAPLTSKPPEPDQLSAGSAGPGLTVSARMRTRNVRNRGYRARVSGNAAVLDALLLRLHTETACRRGGALGIHLADLDPDRCLVKLREKGSTVRWQPITPAIANCLVDHAAARAPSLPTNPLLRYHDGHPLTSRRYDHLWKRLGDRLPWVADQGISTHWLRHTTLTWVERHFGYGVARAYAVTPTPPDQPPPMSKPACKRSPPPSPS